MLALAQSSLLLAGGPQVCLLVVSPVSEPLFRITNKQEFKQENKIGSERILLGSREKREIEIPPPRSHTCNEDNHNDTASEVSYTLI